MIRAEYATCPMCHVTGIQVVGGKLKEHEVGSRPGDTVHLLCNNTEPDLPGILDSCEQLHMAVTGGLDAPFEDHEEVYKWLKYRLDNWQRGPAFTVVYDSAVFHLATVALTQYEEWRKR